MDRAAEIAAAVEAAHAQALRLVIVGTESKRDWLPVPEEGELLSLAEHSGIVDHQPEELVLTALAGTPLRELAQALARHEQMLACEPPQYFASGTLGGAVAAGHSGPNRPWGGSIRDAVLGVEMVNGRGERLSFGGQVMKNVAGYDVSRLQAGAYGALGVLLAVSLRVQPRWESTATKVLELSNGDALDLVRSLARLPVPLTGSCWVDGRLHLRVGGNAAAVHKAADTIGGEMSADDGFWERIRDHRHDFFKLTGPDRDREGRSLWRVATPPAAPLPDAEDVLVEWGGGVRWVWHADADAVERYAADVGGWAWRLGSAMPIPPATRKYMTALKQAFDPDGVFVSPLGL